MRIAILGFGREGQSVLKFLQNRGLTRTGTRTDVDELWILDKNPSIKTPPVLKKQLGPGYLKNLKRFDLIFRSPGIPYSLKELVKARSAGVKMQSATKLFFSAVGGSASGGEQIRGLTLRQAQGIKVIGITGTKGKGTTSTLLRDILQRAGKDVYLAGNIGESPLEILPRLSASSQRKSAIVILELSSFQLQDLKISPKYAVILEVFPDHQDAHLNLREYYEAKANIARYQTRGDKIFYFAHDAKSEAIAKKSGGKKIAVNTEKFKSFGPADLKLPGAHNFRNVVMAATVAQNLGIPQSVIKEAVKNFPGTEHRLEFVGNLAGVAFYNDSASTNPQTAAAAILAFPRQSKILIAGGQDKGLDYKPLANALKHSNTSLVILFGENQKKIAGAIQGAAPVESVGTLEEAVRFAKERAHIGSVVIFSPGAASFDMFKNYADRGQEFKKILEALR
ncbi:MAG: UDP-N-acetylmuramoyl-L-alanine--D-glutamate ligase [Patescibacteria group bacterium]